MAQNPTLAGAASKFADLKRRLIFLIGALVVYRIGTHIPVPGVDAHVLDQLYQSQSGGLLGMFNMFSGGAIKRFSVFALGIMPYISASIVFQLAAEILPSLKELKKEGEAGRRKITQYTRYATLLLAIVQGYVFASMLYRQPGLALFGAYQFYFMTVISLVTGTMFLMWLGEQITERGLGNGISVIITAGIVSGLPGAVQQVLSLAAQDSAWIFGSILVFVLVLLVIAFVVFVERAQRRLAIHYQRQQMVGRGAQSAASQHLPLKLNMAGVIPPIFASSLILFPATIASMAGGGEGMYWLKDITAELVPGRPLHMVLFSALIVFFSFFYTALTFQPKDIADNLKRSGAILPGIRPGEQTGRYIEAVVLRLTLIGALYMTAVCLLPEILRSQTSVPFYFGGTSLLIVVVVAMDFMAQLQAHVMGQQYESLMKKANFKGGRN